MDTPLKLQDGISGKLIEAFSSGEVRPRRKISMKRKLKLKQERIERVFGGVHETINSGELAVLLRT